jgi:hypothetical protein
MDPAWIAISYALAGDQDQAFALLEKGFQEKSGFMIHLKSTAAVDPLRSHPRYADLLRRMGLPQ